MPAILHIIRVTQYHFRVSPANECFHIVVEVIVTQNMMVFDRVRTAIVAYLNAFTLVILVREKMQQSSSGTGTLASATSVAFNVS